MSFHLQNYVMSTYAPNTGSLTALASKIGGLKTHITSARNINNQPMEMLMYNLHTLRSAVRTAQDNKCEVITLTIRQAQDIVLEAEQMHGGNRELSGSKESEISQLQAKIVRLEKKLGEFRAVQNLDKPSKKVTGLLPS